MFAREFGPSNLGLVKSGPSGAGCGGMRRSRAATSGPTPPHPPDQWSRPPWRGPRARLKSPMPMPSRSVRPAGNRHSCGDMPPTPPTRYAAICQGCAGLRRDMPRRWRHRRVSARSDKSAGHFRPSGNGARNVGRCAHRTRRACQVASSECALFGGPCYRAPRRRRQHAADIAVPGTPGRRRPQPGRMPGVGGDSRRWERSCPHWGCVRPGRPTGGRERVAGISTGTAATSAGYGCAVPILAHSR